MTEEKQRDVRCGDCGWTGTEDQLGRDLTETPDLTERLDPGSVVPAGECPECGALAYIVDEPELSPEDKVQLLCLEDYRKHAGKIVLTTYLQSITDDVHEEHYLDEPIRVRVDEGQDAQVQQDAWCDDWCDPNWYVSVVGHHPKFSKASSLWLDGPSRNLDGRCEQPSRWELDPDQTVPEPDDTKLCHGIRLPSPIDDVVTLCGVHVNTVPAEELEHHTIATTEESITCQVCLAYKGKRRTLDRDGTPVIEDLVVEDGNALVKISHRLIQTMALAMFKLLDDARAPNCLEAIFEDPKGTGEEVIVTVQRKSGLTPMQLVAEEKALLDEAVDCLAEIRDGDGPDSVWYDIKQIIEAHDLRRREDGRRKAAAEAFMAIINEEADQS